jgi:hypothetical protein
LEFAGSEPTGENASRRESAGSHNRFNGGIAGAAEPAQDISGFF